MSVFLRWFHYIIELGRRVWLRLVDVFHGRPAYEEEVTERRICPFINMIWAFPEFMKYDSPAGEKYVVFREKPIFAPKRLRVKRYPNPVPPHLVPSWLQGLRYCRRCMRLSWFERCPWDREVTVPVQFFDELEEV